MASDTPCINLCTPSPTHSDGADDDADLVLEENTESFLTSSRKRPLSTASSSSSGDGTCDVQVSSKQKIVIAVPQASSSTTLVVPNIPHCRHKCPVHRFDTSASRIDTKGIFTMQTHVNKEICDECYCFICDIKASSCADWIKHCNASPTHRAWINLRARHGVPLLSEMQGDPLTFLSRKASAFPLEYDTDRLGLEYPLTRYQKMTVSFMVNVEKNGVVPRLFRPKNAGDTLPALVHGGILACEVGMGKTATVIATILANPLDGVTLFVVPPILEHQTRMEMNKFSKIIKVDYIYGPTATEQNQRRMVQNNVDVVVISSGSKLADCLEKRVLRVVFDEAHITESGAMPRTSRAFNINFLSAVRHVWTISGTPLEFGFDDKGFLSQGRLIVKIPVEFAGSSATIDDAQSLIFRLTKDAFPEYKWPSVIHTKLSFDLSAKHRHMYDFLGCIDAHNAAHNASMNPNHTQRDLADFEVRTHLRRLLLSENYDELERSLTGIASAKFKCNDTMEASTIMAYKLKFNAVYDNFFNKGGRDDNTKLLFVINEIKKQKATNTDYVAIIVTEKTDIAIRFFDSGLRIGVLQPPKGKAKYRENVTKQKFEDGEFDVLICSFMPMSLGLNLQLASEIFFIDLVTKENVYKQALGRVSRLSSLHDQVKITAVCVKDTIGELYCDYWADRRNGIVYQEAIKKLWIGDKPHCMTLNRVVYRPDVFPFNIYMKDGKYFEFAHVKPCGHKNEMGVPCMCKVPLNTLAADGLKETLQHTNAAVSVIKVDDPNNVRIRLGITETKCFMLYSTHCTGFRVTLIRKEKGTTLMKECTFNIIKSSKVASEDLPSTSYSSGRRMEFFEATVPFDYFMFHPDGLKDYGFYVYPCIQTSESIKCLISVEYIISKDERAPIYCPALDYIAIGKCQVSHCSLCGFHRELKLLDVQTAGDRKAKDKSPVKCYNLMVDRSLASGRPEHHFSLSTTLPLARERNNPTNELIDYLYEQHEETFIIHNRYPFTPNGTFIKDDVVDKDFFEKNQSFTSAVICLPEDIEVGDLVQYTFNNEDQLAYVDEIIVIPFEDGDLKNCVKTWVRKARTGTIVRIMESKKF